MGNKVSKKAKKQRSTTNSPQQQPQPPPPLLQPQQPKQQQPQPPQQPPQQPPEQQRRFRSLYDFDGQAEGDLSFRRGDVIIVTETAATVSGGGQWLVGQVAGTDRRGFVPSNFLADLQPDDPKLLPGYYNYGRPDAEKELVRPAHQAGAYIIRPCASSAESLALSVKYRHLEVFKIYHYKVKRSPANGQVYITDSKTFSTVSALLEFYASEPGLVCKLTSPVDTNTKPVVPFRDLVIDEQLIKCTIKLGSGSFGVVFRGKLMNKIDVAVKQLKMNSSINTAEDSLVEEAKTQYRLSHRNIIQLIGFTHTKAGEFWLIMEFAEKGSLHSRLGQRLEFSQQIDYIRQVANGMAYLEKEQVVHRDLRAANILLTCKDEVKIADFGLARVIEKSESQYTVDALSQEVYNGGEACKFPIRWTSPEGINYHEFSVKSDVWSFGVCVYEVVSGAKKPYIGMNNQQVIDAVNSAVRLQNPLDGKFDSKDPRSNQAKYLYEEVMLHCWHANPLDRPTFSTLSATFEDFENVVNSRYNMYD